MDWPFFLWNFAAQVLAVWTALCVLICMDLGERLILREEA